MDEVSIVQNPSEHKYRADGEDVSIDKENMHTETDAHSQTHNSSHAHTHTHAQKTFLGQHNIFHNNPDSVKEKLASSDITCKTFLGSYSYKKNTAPQQADTNKKSYHAVFGNQRNYDYNC